LIPQLFAKSKVRGSLATALIPVQEKFASLYFNLKCKPKFSLTRFRPKSREISHNPNTVPCKLSFYRLLVTILGSNLLYTYFFSQISLHYSFTFSRPSKKLPQQSTGMKNYYESLQDNPAEGMDLGPEAHESLQKHYQDSRDMNPDISDEDFLVGWGELVFSQIGCRILLDDGYWDVAENSITMETNFSLLIPKQFSTSSNFSSSPPGEPPESPVFPQPPEDSAPAATYWEKLPEDVQTTNTNSDLPVSMDLTPSSPNKRSWEDSQPQQHESPLPEGEKRVKSKSSATKSTIKTFPDISPSVLPTGTTLLEYPVKLQQTLRQTFLVTSAEFAAYLLTILPDSISHSFSDIELLISFFLNRVKEYPVGLIANYNTGEANSGAWNAGAFQLEGDLSKLFNNVTLTEGLFMFLPFLSMEEASESIKKLLFASINGRKDPSNRIRLSQICRSFSEAKGCTHLLPFSFIVWHSDLQVTSDLVSSSDQFPAPTAQKQSGISPTGEAAATLNKFRNSRPPSFAAVVVQPIQMSEETSLYLSKLSRISLFSSFLSHIVTVSMDTNYSLGHQLSLLRRSLAFLSFPIADTATRHAELFQWAEDLTQITGRSLIACHSQGHRSTYVHILRASIPFGDNEIGATPAIIGSSNRFSVDLTPQEAQTAARYHIDGYRLPPKPNILHSSIPPHAEDALSVNPPPILLHVRGLGDNVDAHNLLYPLVMENILLSTSLTLPDIFLVANVIHASSGQLKNNREVMVEENVLTVLYNPSIVPHSHVAQALQRLGLADSSQSVKVSLRGIPVEYIGIASTILTRPVPDHVLEPINSVMIPLAPGASGLEVVRLLIAMEVISQEQLLHFALLPANPNGKREFCPPRLYLFLVRGAQFRDALITGRPELLILLSSSEVLYRRFFKSERLPGLQAALLPSGSWARNRALLLNGPRAQLSQNPPASFKPHTVPSQVHVQATPSAASTQEAESVCSNTSDGILPSGDLSGDFNRMTVHSPPPLYIAQQQSMAVKQDTQISQSDAMIALLHDISQSLKRLNLPSGSRGAEST